MNMRTVWAVFFLTACGAAISDGNLPLVNDYVFTNNGGLEKFIDYRGENIEAGAFIDATVVAYSVKGDYIAALQQPRRFELENQTPRSWAEKKCDYWIINSQDHIILGPFDVSEFLETSALYGFDETSLSVPATDKVSRYCFNEVQ